VTVTWTTEYYVLFNDVPFQNGTTVVKVSNQAATKLGPSDPSAWAYGNPDGFTPIPNTQAPSGSASVTYFNPAKPDHPVTIGFGQKTTIAGKDSVLPLGAMGSQEGFTTQFVPHEVVYIGLYALDQGLAIDISNASRVYQFEAKPNANVLLKWDPSGNKFTSA
jgi:hypothetical protein